MSDTIPHKNNNLKSILVLSVLILHLLVFLISGLLHDSTTEETLSVFRCDEFGMINGTLHAEPFACDTDSEPHFLSSAGVCCLFIIFAILPWFGGLNAVLEFPIEEFEQYASKLSWLIIFSCLVPAVVGFNFIVEENKFMNEQFEEIEASNYRNSELRSGGGVDFEESYFFGIVILFGGTSAIGSLTIWMGILEEKEKKEREKEKEGES